MMKSYLPNHLDLPCSEPDPAEEARIIERMEMYDALCPQERELVQEYGLARAVAACRKHYGRWKQARAELEAERQALQVQRWERI